ncbi:hypothetical protein BBP40_008219 [Aspergillus hancockii]|nr:hypothetical protein BBP40_008219 [Aspergillus hancockii]
MEQCSRDLPPIKGVIQMAMVLRDVIFEDMTYDQWTVPLRPKIQRTWNVHQYFDASRPLDFFVICSSTSGIHSYPSQLQYAASNTYQDALAAYRRARGLKAVAVNLTIIRDVGILAEQGTTGNIAIWEEALGIKDPAFHALMKALITGQQGPELLPPHVSTGVGTADIMAAYKLALPDYFRDPRFGPTVDKTTEIITDALTTKVAGILQIPASEVDPGWPLYRYGVDSLVALEDGNWIIRETKLNVALPEILAAVPMESFAETIAARSKHLAAA